MSEPTLDWRAMDRGTLDRAYNNAAAVPETAAIFDDWDRRSAAVRRLPGAVLDLVYGDRPRNRIDFIPAAPGAPTLVFIHGGYWQMRSKDSFSFIADGPLSQGINVALVGYTLAPEATMDDMVAEIRSALDWLVVHLPDLGGDPAGMIVSGWSAGAQLAAMMLDHPATLGCLAVSGLYDLEPMRHCFVNDRLNLDAESVRRNSPIQHVAPRAVPLVVSVGGMELPLMRQQSHAYAEACAAAGQAVSLLDRPGRDHFTILEDLSDPAGALCRALAPLAAAR